MKIPDSPDLSINKHNEREGGFAAEITAYKWPPQLIAPNPLRIDQRHCNTWLLNLDSLKQYSLLFSVIASLMMRVSGLSSVNVITGCRLRLSPPSEACLWQYRGEERETGNVTLALEILHGNDTGYVDTADDKAEWRKCWTGDFNKNVCIIDLLN